MNGTSDLGSFSGWYKLLVRNKMAGPGLSVAGLAVGVLLLQLTSIVPSQYDQHVGFLGLRIMDVSAAVLSVLIIGYGVFWLRFVAKKRTFP